MPDRDSFPRASPKQIRAASRKFTPHTAQSLDLFHPRHVGMLCDSGLETLACIYEGVESIGLFPTQVCWMVLPLIEKPRGGLRGVLLCAGVVRVWQRARRQETTQHQEQARRKFWATGKGNSAVSIVWNQAVKAEAAAGKGLCSAAVIIDAQKYYESFQLSVKKPRVCVWCAPCHRESPV